MSDIYFVWNSLGWLELGVFLVCLMGLYYYKSWVNWHFKNKNFDAKFKQTATIQVAPEKKKREW